jgi:hypothetical protein
MGCNCLGGLHGKTEESVLESEAQGASGGMQIYRLFTVREERDESTETRSYSRVE